MCHEDKNINVLTKVIVLVAGRLIRFFKNNVMTCVLQIFISDNIRQQFGFVKCWRFIHYFLQNPFWQWPNDQFGTDGSVLNGNVLYTLTK
jgi:hypothetical protein